MKYGFVGIKQTGSKERKFKGVVTEEEQVIEAVYAKPKELPSRQVSRQNNGIPLIGLMLGLVGLGSVATYLRFRKTEEKRKKLNRASFAL